MVGRSNVGKSMGILPQETLGIFRVTEASSGAICEVKNEGKKA